MPVRFLYQKKSPFANVCDTNKNLKRQIAMGAGVEQRPWTPTVRRGKIGAETSSPGPACVLLPNYVGGKVQDSKKLTAPAFTFGQRHKKSYDTLGPGPAQYNVYGLGNKGKDSAPASTLQSRPKALGGFQTPAPGEYDVDRSSKAVIVAKPKFTFGQKCVLTKESISPAPNVYKIPTVLGVSKEGPIRSAPAFSMTGRGKPRRDAGIPLPGPGYYDAEYTVVKKNSPTYTMGGKFDPPTDEHMKPGPGAHCPEKYIKQKSIPAPSFGILHTPYLGKRKPYLLPEIRTRTCQQAVFCDPFE